MYTDKPGMTFVMYKASIRLFYDVIINICIKIKGLLLIKYLIWNILSNYVL